MHTCNKRRWNLSGTHERSSRMLKGWSLVAHISRRKSISGRYTYKKIEMGNGQSYSSFPYNANCSAIVHHGFDKVMPEKYMFGRKPLVPLWGKNIDISIEEPIEFDLPKLKQTALSESRNFSYSVAGWPTLRPSGLDEAAQRYLYTSISEQIRTVMEKLRNLGKAQAVNLDQRTEL